MSELREAIEAAFEDNESEETLPETGEIENSAGQDSASFDEDLGDSADSADSNDSNAHKENEREIKAARDDLDDKKPSPDKKGAPDAEKVGAHSGESTAKANKAPASWTPKAREAWAKLPEEARAEVMKREREINKVLQESSAARQAATELNNVLSPYKEGLIAAGVHNPIQQVGNLLAVESRLRQGNQTEKALTVANLIKSYGIDIGELDNVLSNQGYGGQQQQGQPQQGAHNAELERLIEQRMAPVNQFLQQQTQMQQYQQQQERQQATQTVEQFSQNAEFMNDVRMDMADLMDMAANRGQHMTIEDAYNKACMLNPEIAGVLKQREEQQRLMNTQNNMQRKRTAASSISGRQSGPTSQRSDDSLRGSLMDAWDAVTGG